MLKKILVFVGVLSLVMGVCYPLHDYCLIINDLYLGFSLLKVYVFHVLAAILIYTMVLLVYSWREDQAAYVFLVGVFIKIGLFVLIFNGTIFQKTQLEIFEKVTLLIPFFGILSLEAVFISKILNQKKV